MEVSIITAKIIALTYISFGIAVLREKAVFSQFIADFEKSPALIFLTGFIALIIGMLLVEHHNVWAKNWTVLITLIGWASLLKGIMLLAFPEAASQFKNLYSNTRVSGIFIIAIGLLFGYFGFIR